MDNEASHCLDNEPQLRRQRWWNLDKIERRIKLTGLSLRMWKASSIMCSNET